MIKFCKKCIMPNSRPRVRFNKEGICNACLNAEEKLKINWGERKLEFENIIEKIKSNRKKNRLNYDCIVPWSGGKDSSYIATKLKFEFGLNPLLVTFSPLIQNAIGRNNREELIKLGFDNFFFSPNTYVAKRLSKRFFIERGNPKVAWDAGINSIPVRVALSHNIKTIFYAEHGESEYGGLVLNKESSKIRDEREVIEHQIGDYPENWIDDKIKLSDIYPYTFPNQEELKEKQITSYYFSYFFKWSMFENYKYLKNKMPTFQTDPLGRTEGTFTDFDSLDDKMDNLYYYMQYIKFGFGRATRDSCRMIQNNQMSRDEAINNARKFDSEFPKRYLKEIFDYLNLKELDFEEIVNKHRNNEIWEIKGNDWKLINKI